jgi:calcineurin-like phosphoesterase family protein
MIYFTSDPHYNHENIVGPKISKWKSGYRDFDSIPEMNKKLVESYKVAKPGDTIFCLGDWAFGREDSISEFAYQIDPDVDLMLIYGNHDKKIKRSKHLQSLFNFCGPVWEGMLEGHQFYLHHYAGRTWENSHRGCIHLYGHNHGTIPDYGKSMDVGWDTCNYGHEKYTLYTIDEILSIMKNRDVSFPSDEDHHKR